MSSSVKNIRKFKDVIKQLYSVIKNEQPEFEDKFNKATNLLDSLPMVDPLNSSIKENININSISKQGIQGVWLNETCELASEQDTPCNNMKRGEIVVNSLKAKSVVYQSPTPNHADKVSRNFPNNMFDK